MNLKNDFLDALLKEMEIRKDYIRGEAVETVYFGGGTPSLLTELELNRIMDALRETFPISSGAEISFEANPDDITAQSVNGWRNAGINRLSIGVQSFFEEDLQWMNRAHSADQAARCITLSQDAGITNMSIDLIYGSPTLTDEKWMSNLETATAAGVPHLSCYALTVEPGTALDTLTRKGKKQQVSNDDQERQFAMMTGFLHNKGYEHYEISNFALPGKRSRHNSSYWRGQRYIGLGPSAHSFDGSSRQWNIANNASYIKSLQQNIVPFEIEHLTTDQRFNEYVMVSLRTIEGVDIQFVEKEFGTSRRDSLRSAASGFMTRGWIQDERGKLILTGEGKLFADGIAAELFAD